MPESWKDRTAASFIRSAQFAGALDDTGFLRVRALREAQLSKALSETTVASMQTSTPVVSGLAATIPVIHKEAQSVDTNVWNFTYQGKNVRLITPTELDYALWEKLNGYVKLIEPTKAQ